MVERDLDHLLARLTVSRRSGTWCLVSGVTLDGATTVAAQVSEDEGITSVIRMSDAARLGIAPEFVAAWLTLEVHSALDAVGLTAVVSSALAARGIACNVLTGLHHDHLLVPADRAEEAMDVLAALRRDALPATRAAPGPG